MKKNYLLLFALLFPLVMSADKVKINGLWYNLIEKAHVAEVAPSDTREYQGDITIPDSIEYESITYHVTCIGDNAFKSCTALKTVHIPNTITKIGNYAFNSCLSLSSLSIPTSVTSIGSYAFSWCISLSSIIIPNSVDVIASGTFNACTGLSSITIPSSIRSIEWDAFYGCDGLSAVHITSLEDWCQIDFHGENPLRYAHHLFINNEEIKELIIPNSVTTINTNAFWGLNIVSLFIPGSVSKIEQSAFIECSSLVRIVLSEGLSEIDRVAFANCPKLEDVYSYSESVPKCLFNAFENSYIEYCTLHVPEKSIDLYKNSDPWNKFKQIVALTDSDSDPSGVSTIIVDSNKRNVWYSLNGRRLNDEPKVKGIYIRNGNKVVK